VILSHARAPARARASSPSASSHLDNPWLAARHDGAVLEVGGARLAFTTDTFVVHPSSSGRRHREPRVHGTLNDLAMCGARPLALSCALVLEEGLPLDAVERVPARSARPRARRGCPS